MTVKNYSTVRNLEKIAAEGEAEDSDISENGVPDIDLDYLIEKGLGEKIRNRRYQRAHQKLEHRH